MTNKYHWCCKGYAISVNVRHFNDENKAKFVKKSKEFAMSVHKKSMKI